jgi:ribosomal protein S18 acetylase RimI-like enzyme
MNQKTKEAERKELIFHHNLNSDILRVIAEVFGESSAEYIKKKGDIFDAFAIYLDDEIAGSVLVSDGIYGMKEISKLAVRPEFQGRGLATTLLNMILEEYKLKDKQYACAFGEALTSHPISQHVFEKVGFQPVGIQPKKLHSQESLTLHLYKVVDANFLSTLRHTFELFYRTLPSLANKELVVLSKDRQYNNADMFETDIFTGRIYNSSNGLSIIKQLSLKEGLKIDEGEILRSVERFLDSTAKYPWLQVDIEINSNKWIWKNLGFIPIALLPKTKEGDILRLCRFDNNFPKNLELTEKSREVYNLIQSLYHRFVSDDFIHLHRI